jgi:hypothetical protein
MFFFSFPFFFIPSDKKKKKRNMTRNVNELIYSFKEQLADAEKSLSTIQSMNNKSEATLQRAIKKINNIEKLNVKSKKLDIMIMLLILLVAIFLIKLVIESFMVANELNVIRNKLNVI